jgi:hypothetical protein
MPSPYTGPTMPSWDNGGQDDTCYAPMLHWVVGEQPPLAEYRDNIPRMAQCHHGALCLGVRSKNPVTMPGRVNRSKDETRRATPTSPYPRALGHSSRENPSPLTFARPPRLYKGNQAFPSLRTPHCKPFRALEPRNKNSLSPALDIWLCPEQV